MEKTHNIINNQSSNGIKLSNGLERAKEHAISKGGQCLSIEYINSHSKLEWKCHSENHLSWFANYTNILHSNTWCPECGKENYNNSTKRLSNSLNKAKEYAMSKGGQCLSNERINGQHKLEWKCHNENHLSWFSSYNNVVNLICWCPECGKESMKNKKKLVNGLEKSIQHALSKGGRCLSMECINSDSELEWKCDNQNHPSWFAKYTNVVNSKTWCPACAIEERTTNKVLKNGLELAKVHAEFKGGRCLSSEYVNSYTKMEWKCHNSNHSLWAATYSHVINCGSWCPECGAESNISKKTLVEGLEKASLHAISKGGQCLSIECINSSSKLEWKCDKTNHSSWFATYSGVLNKGSWCRQCQLEIDFPSEKYFKLAKENAISKGGLCLSSNYINNSTKMEWKCHVLSHPSWFSIYASIVNMDTWCPECGLVYNIQEFKVQQILNYLFKTIFTKNRSLAWNTNTKTGYILELDGYSKDLQLAFEFQGRYHFQDNIFKGINLEDVQYKDKIKKDNCAANGVKLIIINELQNKNCFKFFTNIVNSIQNAEMTIPSYEYSEIERLYKLRPKN